MRRQQPDLGVMSILQYRGDLEFCSWLIYIEHQDSIVDAEYGSIVRMNIDIEQVNIISDTKSPGINPVNIKMS